MKKYPIFAALLTGFLLVASCQTPTDTPASADVIYLVRHAEKAPGPDPDLTNAGVERADLLAELLAELLGDTDIAAVYATDYKRTRQTALPTARAFRVPILYYDPGDLQAFADQLKGETGRLLVVGHSNTTPQLVAALGGDPGTPIVEATEYDRLYVLTRNGEGFVTELRRYGTANPSSPTGQGS